MRRGASWIVAEAAMLAFSLLPAPLVLRIAAAYLAFLLPGYLLATGLLPGASRREDAPGHAFALALLLGLALGLLLQLTVGFSPLRLASALLAATAALALAGVARPAPWSPEARAAAFAIGGFALVVPAAYAAFDPNRTAFVTFDAWATFAAARTIGDAGALPGLDFYPRGFHFFFASPLILSSTTGLDAMVEAVTPWRSFLFLGTGLLLWSFGRALGLGGRVALLPAVALPFFLPGGDASVWHLMPQAASLLLFLSFLVVVARPGASEPRGVVLAGVLLVGSLYVHPMTTVAMGAAAIAFAAVRQPRAFPLAAAAMLGGAAALVYVAAPPGLVLPGLEHTGVEGLRSPAARLAALAQFHPLPLVAAGAVAGAACLFRSSPATRAVGLLVLVFTLLALNGALLPTRWYLYAHALLVPAALLAIPARRPRLRAAPVAAALALLVLAAGTHALYWEWAQGDVTREETALFERVSSIPCRPVSDGETLRRLGIGGGAYIRDLLVPPPTEALPTTLDALSTQLGGSPLCIVLTPRTPRWLADPSDPTLALPSVFVAHPSLAPLANGSALDRVHASAGADHLLFHYAPGAPTGPARVLLLTDATAERNNSQSRWVAEVALLRIGEGFVPRPASGLATSDLATVSLVVAPTNDLVWRMEEDARVAFARFVRDGGPALLVGGDYGKFAPDFGVDALVDGTANASRLDFRVRGESRSLSFAIPLAGHRYALAENAEVLATDERGRPAVWRVAMGSGTVVLAPFQRISSGEDEFRLLRALVHLARRDDGAALDALSAGSVPGEHPFREPASAFAAGFRATFRPHEPHALVVLTWGPLLLAFALAARAALTGTRGTTRSSP